MKRCALTLTSTLLIACCGCGGGTTGTSSTGELKILGTSQNAFGTPISETPMTIYSADSNEELLASQTDEQGIFEMSLAPEEQSVTVEISGQRTAPLVRSYSGSSVLSTTLVQTSDGRLTFGTGFEVQIDSSSLCPGASTTGNSLNISEEQIAGSCGISIQATSHGDTPLVISGEVRSDCGNISQVTDGTVASSDGVLQLSLAAASSEGCVPREIVLRANADNVLPITIPLR